MVDVLAGVKKVIFEFGGKFFFFVFVDFDLENVVKGVMVVNFFI